jgi:hypothetical protein
MNSSNENYENYKVVEHLIDLRIGLRSAYPKHENALKERKDLKEEKESLLLKMDDEIGIKEAIKLHKEKYKEESIFFENNYEV